MKYDDCKALQNSMHTLRSDFVTMCFMFGFLPCAIFLIHIGNLLGFRAGFNNVTFTSVLSWTFMATVTGVPTILFIVFKHTGQVIKKLNEIEAEFEDSLD